MLGKLLKYDFLAVGKKLFPIYAALFISVIGLNINIAVYNGLDFGIIGGIFAFLFTLSTMAVFVGTVVVLIRHFYVNLFTDQGYLTMVLPVGEGTLLVSKLLNGAIYSLFSCIAVFFASIFTASNSFTFDSFAAMITHFQEGMKALNFFGLSYGYMWFVIIVYILIGLFSGQIMGCFCIILGQKWSKHRVIGAILIGLGLYVLNMIIFSCFAVGNVGPLMSLNQHNALTEETIKIIMNYGTSIINYTMIVTLIESVAAYVLSWFILKKHTNIE